MKVVATFLVTLSLMCSFAKADVIVFEDFEDSLITYSANVADDLSDVSIRNYFGRIAADTASPPADVSYSNLQGSGYYGVQDSDDTVSSATTIELTWSGISTANFTDLELSWMIAEDDASNGDEDWDIASSFRIEVDSGTGYANVFQVEAELGGDGNETNEKPRVDTDFDGVGDGTEITDIFQSFNVSLADAASYNIRVTMEFLDSGDEDIAFDSLMLSGTSVVPEPTMTGMLLLGVVMMGGRRRRN